MNLQQLRAFTTVAQLENISKAADFLHCSQSSLSKQIAKLEAELGVVLFDRKGKKITLNKAGMSFYESSSQILQELHAAEENLKILSRSQATRIRIGVCGIPEGFLHCIEQFAQEYPEMEIVINSRIEFTRTADINDYDALICPEGYKYEKLSGYHLFDEKYYFAVPAKADAAKEKAFAVKMLEKHPAVFLHEDEMTPEFPYRICQALGLSLKSVFFTDSKEIHRQMISGGAACGFVPKTEAEAFSSDKRIRLLPILDRRFTQPMKICFLREKHLSELGRKFREYVIRYYQLEQSE